ncbi:MAG: polysaccharide deacetylase family protein, partial [Clostridia bacterium]|nr:polysaccharide deacetylase family protein [Clostridia bacterium]
MIQYHVYPGGKKRIVTFSYDDGHHNDERLVALFNKYGVKGTFHLNGKKYIGKTEEELEEYRKRYEGHEIACHTLTHGWPARMPLASLTNEIMEDRRILEHMAGYPVIGMSYPSGSYSDEAIVAHRACGIVYSRTVDSHKRFLLPNDFL